MMAFWPPRLRAGGALNRLWGCQAGQFCDRLLVIWFAENGRADDEELGSRRTGPGDSVRIDAAVDFQKDFGGDKRAELPELIQGDLVKRLPAEAGLHAHDQHDVAQVQAAFDAGDGGGG